MLVDVLDGTDAVRGAGHVVLMRLGCERVSTAHEGEGDITLEDVKVPRYDGPLLRHLDQYLKEQRNENEVSGLQCPSIHITICYPRNPSRWSNLGTYVQ